MSYKLVPRFNYTLSFPYYFKLWKKKNTSNIFDKPESDSKVYYFNQARVGLRVLLNSISKQKLNVGVQAYTCHTVFQAIHNSGNNIVFIDLTDEFKLDLNDLSKKIAKIDVLIITHTFGFPDYMDGIKKIAKDKIIIEDCSHSFLSKYNGQYTGTIGDAAIFSTGLAKFPPIGAGGFCLINNPKIFPYFESEYSNIPKPSNLASVKSFAKAVLSSILLKPPLFGLFTYNFIKKLDQKLDVGNKFSFKETKGYKWVQVIFNNNLNYFYKEHQKQEQNFNFLASKISAKYFDKQILEANTPNYYIFPLLSENRDKLYNKLLESNIQAGKHFHKCLEWAKEFGYKKGNCHNVEILVDRVLTVPIHKGVKKNDLKKIICIINEF
jgi:dTDP-4-amino-4,6-dideoxygalactose transaminase